MQIRLATAQDAPAISDLIHSLAEKYIANELSEEGSRNLLESMTPEAIHDYLQQAYRYHVAEQDDELLGVVATRDNQHLYHLFVAEACHRQGLATRLWAVAKQACLDAGNPGTFTVNSSRFAVGLYLRFGFVQTGPLREENGVKFIPMQLVDR